MANPRPADAETDRHGIDWYRLSVDEAAAQVDSDTTTGLSLADAQQRLQQHGPNLLVDRGGRGRC